jgi:hypothetical protein
MKLYLTLFDPTSFALGCCAGVLAMCVVFWVTEGVRVVRMSRRK